MRRYLDHYEIAHLNAPTAFVTDCAGELDDSALAAAFDLLCVQHPALRGHVRHDGHGYVLDARHGHHARFGPQWTPDYPREVAAAWNVEESLATLTVTRMSDRVRVAFYLDHCIGDGRHLYALCQSLWRLYSDITTGAKIAVRAPRRLPPPPLTVLAERTGTRVTTTEAPHTTTPLPTLRYRRLLLTREETTTLVSNARTRGVSVYALLAAAVAHAQQASTIWAVVDLRDRVDPPVGPTDTTNFASAVTLALRDRTASEVRTQLLAAIADGKPHRNMRDDAVGRSMAEPRPSHAAAIVSNLGSVPEFAAPPGLSIADFTIWPYGWNHPCPMYMASTYGSRLGVDMVFRTDASADQLSLALKQTLTGT